MKTKFFLIVLISLIVAPSIFSAGQKEQAAENVTMRLASILAQTTPVMQGAQKFAEILKKDSDGKIDVKIYAGGTMGGENDNLESLKMGELQMGIFGTLPITMLTPKYSFFDAPFLFRDKTHFLNVWNGKLGKDMQGIFLNEHGIRILGLAGRGDRHITSNVLVESVADMPKLKIRTPQSKPFMTNFTALGSIVVPIALPELFTSLQAGVVNASEGPFDQIVTNKLHEVQKYIAIISHYPFSPSVWMMNEKFFKNLPASQKSMIEKAAVEATAYASKLGEEREAELKKICTDRGVKLTKVDIVPFIEKVQPAMKKLFAEMWPVTTPEEIAKY
jgi:tripartite ATP-independent transporter DctP family solute receptor